VDLGDQPAVLVLLQDAASAFDNVSFSVGVSVCFDLIF
jgi:hypothetical protein